MKYLSIIFWFMATILVSCNSANTDDSATIIDNSEVVLGHQHDQTSSKDSLVAFPEGAEVFFVNLQDGQVVKPNFKVEMGIKGMEVRPAGEVLYGTGHHHIIVNGPFYEPGQIIPKDSLNIHFGGGETETELNLKPGVYELTLQFANGAHMSFGKVLSKTIKIEVKN